MRRPKPTALCKGEKRNYYENEGGDTFAEVIAFCVGRWALALALFLTAGCLTDDKIADSLSRFSFSRDTATLYELRYQFFRPSISPSVR